MITEWGFKEIRHLDWCVWVCTLLDCRVSRGRDGDLSTDRGLVRGNLQCVDHLSLLSPAQLVHPLSGTISVLLAFSRYGDHPSPSFLSPVDNILLAVSPLSGSVYLFVVRAAVVSPGLIIPMNNQRTGWGFM